MAVAQLGDPAIVRVIVKSVVITLLIVAGAGGVIMFALYNWLISLGVAYSAELGAIGAVLLTLIASWLLFRVIALVVLQFFADEIIAAVEAQHYPQHSATVRKIPFREELGHALRGGMRALGINLLALPLALVLLITGVGTALLFWAVNGWLLGRELQDMVWLRHRANPDEPLPLGGSQRFMLGGAVAGIMFVPFLNLLAPVIGAAAATHMVHGRGEAS